MIVSITSTNSGGSNAVTSITCAASASSADSTQNSRTVLNFDSQLGAISMRPTKLQELVELGDANGNPWRLYVGMNQTVYYNQISTTPRYFVYKRGLVEGGINPWTMQPAVVRDTNWPGSDWAAEGWLESALDFYASEISVSMDNVLSIRTELFDEDEILENQLEFLEQNIPEED